MQIKINKLMHNTTKLTNKLNYNTRIAFQVQKIQILKMQKKNNINNLFKIIMMFMLKMEKKVFSFMQNKFVLI